MDKRKVLVGAAIAGLVTAGVVSHSTPAFAGKSKAAKHGKGHADDHHDAKKGDACNTPNSCQGHKADEHKADEHHDGGHKAE